MASLLERLLGDGTPDEQVDLEARQADANERLQEAIDPDAMGIDDCAVTGVAVVNEGPDGEPIVVPIARFSLGESVEEPDMDLVWELVPVALRALHGTFADVYVRHYDVQFVFDGDELFEAEECRRMAVPQDYAETLLTGPSFDRTALRQRMLDEDDIDDEIAPVAWGACRDYTDATDAAVVTGGAAAAAAASSSAAACASAGGAC